MPCGYPPQRWQHRIEGPIERVHHADLEGVAEVVVVVGGDVRVEPGRVAGVRDEQLPPV